MWLLALCLFGGVGGLVVWLRQPVPVQGTFIRAIDLYVPPFEASGVAVFRIAIDARARRFVEKELSKLDADMRDGAQLLRRVRDVWLHASMERLPGSRSSFEDAVAGASGALDTPIVTLVIATRHELDICATPDAEQVRRSLETVSYRDDVVAAFICCAGVGDATVAVQEVDARFCSACGAPNIVQLLRCPYCGMPDALAA